APVVAIVNPPPAAEAPIATAPALLTYAVPGLPVFTVKVVPADVSILFVLVPILPVPDDNATVVPVNVPAVCVMLPVPLADTVVVVPPPEFAASEILPLLVVASVIAPLAPTVTAPLSVNPIPPFTFTVVLPPLTVPVSAVPSAFTVRVF